MDTITLASVLEADPRPTLVLDLSTIARDTRLSPVYSNKSAKSHVLSLNILELDTPEGIAFRQWACVTGPLASCRQAGQPYHGPNGTSWVTYDIESRWRVLQDVSACIPPTPVDVVSPSESLNSDHGRLGFFAAERPTIVSGVDVKSMFGIDDKAMRNVVGLREHINAIVKFDWQSTWLGPLQDWPVELLQLVQVMLLDPAPQCMYLGPEKTMLYNAAHATLAGDKHPAILGQPLFVAWKGYAHITRAMFESIDSTGSGVVLDDHNVSLMRNGFLEELHLKRTMIPLQKPLNGYLCYSADETVRKVTERRKAFFTRVSEACRGLRDMSQYWAAVLETLGTNGKDFPFAFVYSKDMVQESIYRLEGVLDCKDGSQVLPSVIDVESSSDIFVPALREALHSPKPVWIRHSDGTLPEQISTLSETRGSHDRCLEGLACAIRRASDQLVLGFLVVGTNTRKNFTTMDHSFTMYMTKTLGDLATNTVNAQDADRLAKLAASQERALMQALESTTLEANNVSAKLQIVIKTMETVDVGFFEMSAEGKLLQANEAFFKISGHPRGSQVVGMWRDTIHEDDIDHCQSLFGRVGGGEHVNLEYRYKPRGQDGYIWASASVVPIVNEHDHITTLSGCVTDITEQKRRQEDAVKRAATLEKLRASEQRFNLFAENDMCPIYIYDADRKLQFFNTAYRNLVGGTNMVATDELSMELVHEDDLAGILELWDDATLHAKSWQCTFRLTRQWEDPDGGLWPAWVIARTAPSIDDNGTLTAWVGVLTDISHLKWAERMQELRKEEALEAKRNQENFIDMTSHEIRNPLGAVVHCADSIMLSLVELEAVIKTPGIPDAQCKQLREIYEASFDAVSTIIACSSHQQRMLEDVLLYSKLNSNLLKICPLVCRPEAILQDMRNMFEMDAQKAGVSFRIVHDTSGPDHIRAEWVMLDVGRLMQVLINLATNAIKFTRTEAVREVTVTMGLTRAQPTRTDLPVTLIPRSATIAPLGPEFGAGAPLHIYFVVSDTGCGLSASEQSRIFSRFAQGSHRTHSKYGGSGLGLYISRELVELQSGSIGFASAPGSGSTFGFYVATRTAECPAHQADVLRSGSSASSPMGRKYSILVVEDNVINQAVLSKQLTRLGHVVHIASQGAEALKFLEGTTHWRHDDGVERGTRVDVVLMDVEMPVMDGLSCVGRIRELQKEGRLRTGLPVVAVSANAREEQIGHAMRAGMDDAISKPFRIVDLMPKIERLVGW